MCFPNAETGSKTTSYQANPAVANAAESNIGFAQNVQNKGFTPYTGQMVANFSPQQSSSFNMADTIGASPNFGTAQNYITGASTAGPGSVNPNTISSMMSPYMNAYVQQSLAPQLENQQQQFNTQNKGAQSNATMAGAFGNDSQDALYRSNLTNQQDIARTGLIGQAYNSAFNTAIGAGAQDVANNLGAQTTNAGLREQALQRQMQGATGLEGLTQSQEGAANLVNQFGQQQTAQQQAGLNAQYQQYQMAQQYPFLSTELMNQTIGAGAQAMPASNTQTSYAPNNSGYALAGAALPFMMGFAEGGEPPVGIPSVVGERGPELVVPGAAMTPAANPAAMTPPALPMAGLPSLGGQQRPQQQQPQQQVDPTTQTPIGQMMAGYNWGSKLTAPDFSSFGDVGASLGGLAGFVDGGTPPVGKPALVGERGAEAVVPKGRGQEVPLHDLVPSTGAHLVGQNGPEIITPKKPVTVIPNHKLPKKMRKPTDDLAQQFGLAA